MKTYRRLLQFVKPYRLRLGAAILFGILSAGAAGAIFFVTREVLNKVVDPAHDLSIATLLGLAALIPLLFLIDGISSFCNGYYVNWVGQRVVSDIRNRLFEWLQGLSLDFHSRADVGQLISRVVNDPAVIEKSVSTAIVDMTKQPFVLLACLSAMFWLDWRLSLASLIVFPICLVPISLLSRRVRRASKMAQLKLAGF